LIGAIVERGHSVERGIKKRCEKKEVKKKEKEKEKEKSKEDSKEESLSFPSFFLSVMIRSRNQDQRLKRSTNWFHSSPRFNLSLLTGCIINPPCFYISVSLPL
jgi:hypothetical protein